MAKIQQQSQLKQNQNEQLTEQMNDINHNNNNMYNTDSSLSLINSSTHFSQQQKLQQIHENFKKW